MRLITFVLIVLLSAVAPAQSSADADTPLRRAEAALFAVRDEQQAVYQQFQMIQALQKIELQNLQNPPPAYGPQGQIPNFDDVARARQEQQDRLRSYEYELQQLFARHRDLTAEAAQLLDQVRILSQQEPK